MKFYFKVHRVRGEAVLAACDEDILGKVFESDGKYLEVNRDFYGGDLVEEEELRGKLGTFTIMNFVGNRVVQAAIEEGFVNPENVIIVEGVKHAQAAIL